MKKRISSIFILLLTAITLVGCLNINIRDNKSYEPNSEYETQIIATTKALENTTVALEYIERNVQGFEIKRGKGASAVVIDVHSSVGIRTVTAITTGQILEKFGEDIVVASSPTRRSSPLIDYAYNIEHDFGIIVFETTALLKAVDLSQTYNYEVGQTILTIGTPSDNEQFNIVKTGVINNDEIDYNETGTLAFIHDAPNNPGEKGAGVFDLNGNLIGLNGLNYLETTIVENNIERSEFVTGMTKAVRTKDFINVLNNLDDVDYENNHIPNALFEINEELTQYEPETSYEANLIALGEELKGITVTVTNDFELATGLIYSKEENLNNYWIITRDFENFDKVAISYDGVNNLNILRSYHLEGMYLSVHKVRSDMPLKTYKSEAIDDGIGTEIVDGQTVVMVSNPLKLEYKENFNVATVAKLNHPLNHLFMHDGVLNYGMQGSPIFNLDGTLIGFNAFKQDYTQSNSTIAIVEGINEAVDLNYVATQIKNITTGSNFDEGLLTEIEPYVSKHEYEQAIIDVVNNNKANTVTVSVDSIGSGSGHGSGIIFKKERTNKGFLYSVLTNAHVINTTNAPEITIIFNDERENVLAKDFAKITAYDLGVVRFESELDFDVTYVEAIEEKINIDFEKGQTVIGIGTPALINRDGYTTTGNLTTPSYTYNGIIRLGMMHNAPINPGNSGGPLFNLNGDLIGLNVSKRLVFSIYDGMYVPAEGIGTALSINVLAPAINNLKEIDYNLVVRKPRLGITIQEIDFYDQDLALLPEFSHGVIVIDVDKDRDAFGKINKYDVITYVNGVKVNDRRDLSKELDGRGYGAKFELQILRLVDGQTVIMTVDIELS